MKLPSIMLKSFSLSLSLSLCLCLFLSLSLSISLSLSLCLSLYLYLVSLSLCLCLYLSVRLSISIWSRRRTAPHARVKASESSINRSPLALFSRCSNRMLPWKFHLTLSCSLSIDSLVYIFILQNDHLSGSMVLLSHLWHYIFFVLSFPAQSDYFVLISCILSL